MVAGILLSLVAILAVAIYAYYKKHERFFKLGSQLPGPRYIETLKRYLDTRKPPEQSE